MQEKSPDDHKIMEDKYKSQVELRCKQRSNSYTCCRQGDCVHPNRFLYYKGAKCTINPCAMFAFQFMCQIFSNNSISPSCWFLSFNLVQLSKKSGKNKASSAVEVGHLWTFGPNQFSLWHKLQNCRRPVYLILTFTLPIKSLGVKKRNSKLSRYRGTASTTFFVQPTVIVFVCSLLLLSSWKEWKTFICN